MRRVLLFLVVLALMFAVGCDDDSGTSGGDAGDDGAVSGGSAKEESFTGSMKDLMSKGAPMKCSWSMDIAGNRASGTVYIKGEMFRSEVNADGETAYSVSDGQLMYVWSSREKQGFKMSLDAAEAGEQDGYEAESGSLEYSDLDMDYNYRCSPWVVSSSKFDPPGDVEFVDLSAMMQQMQQMSEQMEQGHAPSQQDMCAMCDMIPPGPDQDDCMQSCQG